MRAFKLLHTNITFGSLDGGCNGHSDILTFQIFGLKCDSEFCINKRNNRYTEFIPFDFFTLFR